MAELLFHPAAREEAVEMAVYLEENRRGYGTLFEEELAELAIRVVAHPKSGSPVEGLPKEFDVRAYPMKTFRCSMVVAVLDEKHVVIAVADQRRRPGYWQDRLNSPKDRAETAR